MTVLRGGPELPRAVQLWLAETYGIDSQPDVCDFVRAVDGRERLLVQTSDDHLDLRVELPKEAFLTEPLSLDVWCQVVEGVSHFVLLCERLRREGQITHLELELQAEIDKFVVLTRLASHRLHELADLRLRLYGSEVTFTHDQQAGIGRRYRTANRGARKFTQSLSPAIAKREHRNVRRVLRDFYHRGPADKYNVALAA